MYISKNDCWACGIELRKSLSLAFSVSDCFVARTTVRTLGAPSHCCGYVFYRVCYTAVQVLGKGSDRHGSLLTRVRSESEEVQSGMPKWMRCKHRLSY